MILLLAATGCATRIPAGQESSQAPASTVDARLAIEQVQKLEQQISTMQQTYSTQTSTHLLDAGRVKVQLAEAEATATAAVAAHRRDTIRFGQIVGVLIAMIVMMAVARSIVPTKYRPLGYLVAIGIAVAAVFIPMIWPF